MDDIRLGAILLEGGVVDEAGLERCLAVQTLTGSSRPIGQILVEQGLLDEATLKRLLELQRERVETARAQVVATGLACGALLTAAAANGASEIVVGEACPARIRVGTGWRRLTDEQMSGPEVWDLVRDLMGSEVLESLAEHHFVVRSWSLDGIGRGSATAFRHFAGVAMRVTFAAAEVPAPELLGVPAPVVDAVRGGKGLVLVVGERGIGRAELLASMTQLAAGDPSTYVVVVGDEPLPVAPTAAMVERRRYGLVPAQQAAALRSVVREDPDVLVIADVGAAETFEIALRAAEGGRLVIAYIDAANATAALARVLNYYPVHDLPRVRSSLAAVLRTVFVRQLLPDVDHTGTAAASELLVVDETVREIVRRGELSDIAMLLRAEGGRAGHSLDRSMLGLLQAGRVRMEDVFARAEEKAWLLERTRDLQPNPR
ncbi:MAG: Flp pilus assembly complex ATPase component TadA [Planctomycetes bacterium]|jgi:Tfp pilus assembly pilus retraction ATPase PilT|nr:Flp pilus assembly complex ATPase component TadA [Planctomycetota bacterium]